MYPNRPPKGRRDRLEYIGIVMIFGGPALAIAWSLSGAAGGVLALIKKALQSGISPWLVIAVPFVFVGAMWVGMVLMNRARRRSVEALRTHDWMLCLKCRYPLKTLPDEG